MIFFRLAAHGMWQWLRAKLGFYTDPVEWIERHPQFEDALYVLARRDPWIADALKQIRARRLDRWREDRYGDGCCS